MFPPEEADGGQPDQVHVIVAIAEGVDHVDDNGGRLTALLLQYNYIVKKYTCYRCHS